MKIFAYWRADTNYRVVAGSMSRTYDEEYFKKINLLVGHLRQTLSVNSGLLKSLGYYYLFLIKVGVELYFSKANSTSYWKKNCDINSVFDSINEDWLPSAEELQQLDYENRILAEAIRKKIKNLSS